MAEGSAAGADGGAGRLTVLESAPWRMTSCTTRSRGLIDELVDIERRLREAQPPLDERERVESYRWIFSVLQVALDAYVWADTGRPRFVDIVGPNKKWGGDNTDAFYKHAPIDPRTHLHGALHAR